MSARKTISSNPMLRAGLRWTAIVGVAVLVVASIVGWFVAGTDGLWSGVLGAALGALFPIITVASLLLGNRWYGTPSFLTVSFGITMGVLLVKIVVFVVALNVVFGLPWVERLVLYGALVAAALSSLVVDVVVASRMRISGASDVALPGDEVEDDGAGNGRPRA
ncbi:hypothetical protein [Microbacterium album]|uniref:ATP synthase protein I n=1 Tax=Microbacterium album TaxID=2053191 RepID=A0A917IFV3_9MICO|nr:hypothetical protein [Microbacterium album]GGH49133.1 hypothetical protein GCM10010921_27120 [Microbacterium album]